MPRISVRLLPALALALAAGALTTAPADAADDVRPRIQGTVIDAYGAGLLDAKAISVKGRDTQTALAFSYNSTDPDVREDLPGYFFLPSGYGTFKVTISKKGFAPRSYKDLEVVDKRGERVVSLGEVMLDRITAASGKVTNEVRVGDEAIVRVAVTPASARPAGKIQVTSLNGRTTYGSAKLTFKQKGVVTVTLDKLPKGTYDLKAVFKGVSGFADSTSSKFTLEVKGKKKNKRPNARAWVA